MKSKAIYHKEHLEISIFSWMKKVWVSFDNLEHKRFELCLVAFTISVIPTSIAVSFASNVQSDLLLALTVLLSVLTLIFCILEVSVKKTLVMGFVSLIASVITIAYSLAAHSNSLEPYLKLHY